MGLMAKEGSSAVAPFLRELVRADVYKRTQGRVTRQVTAAALGVAVLLGAWRLSIFLLFASPAVRYMTPVVMTLVGLWVVYRAVNYPQFADFLIAVEAEMNKVSWPTRIALVRSSAVVMLTIFLFAAILFMYDIIWSWLLRLLGVTG